MTDQKLIFKPRRTDKEELKKRSALELSVGKLLRVGWDKPVSSFCLHETMPSVLMYKYLQITIYKFVPYGIPYLIRETSQWNT